MSFKEEIPDFHQFREFVENHVNKRRDSELIKAYYLLAARDCELITKASPSDTSTTPYGEHLTFKIMNYDPKANTTRKEYEERLEKILLVKSPVAKRKPVVDKVYYKYIALPCDPKYEPWTLDLLKRIQRKRGDLQFNLTRQAVYNIIKRNMGNILPPKRKNPLRHTRLTHLVTEYGFDPYDLTAYAGWTLKTGFGKTGMAIPTDQLEIYLHFRWREYIQKLLTPLFMQYGLMEKKPPETEEPILERVYDD